MSVVQRRNRFQVFVKISGINISLLNILRERVVNYQAVEWTLDLFNVGGNFIATGLE